MLTTNSFRKRQVKKLRKAGWSEVDADSAALAMFPMKSDPGDRQLETHIRSGSQLVAAALNSRSELTAEEQREIVYEALVSYDAACKSAGRPDYGEAYATAASTMAFARGSSLG